MKGHCQKKPISGKNGSAKQRSFGFGRVPNGYESKCKTWGTTDLSLFLVFTIQLLGYSILTHTQIWTARMGLKAVCASAQPGKKTASRSRGANKQQHLERPAGASALFELRLSRTPNLQEFHWKSHGPGQRRLHRRATPRSIRRPGQLAKHVIHSGRWIPITSW